MNKIVIPKNELKEKVGNGGFDDKNVKAAQTAIEENDIDFAPIAYQYLAQLQQAIAAARASQNYRATRLDLLDVAIQLRAQGAMFHYSSLTAVTGVMVDLLESVETVDEKILEIAVAYERSAQLLLKSGIKPADHPTCRAIVAELKSTCGKYQQIATKT